MVVNSFQKEKFNFELWAELSVKDPQAFEELRQQAVDEFIGSVAEERQERLRCLQWKVDKVRETQKTPLAACVAISDMMWDSLERLNQLYNDYESVSSVKSGKRVLTPLPSAAVIPFGAR